MQHINTKMTAAASVHTLGWASDVRFFSPLKGAISEIFTALWHQMTTVWVWRGFTGFNTDDSTISSATAGIVGFKKLTFQDRNTERLSYNWTMKDNTALQRHKCQSAVFVLVFCFMKMTFLWDLGAACLQELTCSSADKIQGTGWVWRWSRREINYVRDAAAPPHPWLSSMKFMHYLMPF